MRNWLAVLLMLIAAPVSAATTTKFALTTPVWTDLGAGPMIVSSSGLTVFAIGDTTPTIPAYEGGMLPKGDSMDFGTTSHVWAMPAGLSGVSVYTAPAVFRGGGGGAVVSSVWSASDAAAIGATLSNGGLTITPTSGGWHTARTSISKSSGKLYLEFAETGPIALDDVMFGVADATLTPVLTYLGGNGKSAGTQDGGYVNFVSGGFTANYTTVPTEAVTGDVWAEAVDFTTGKIWLARNNVWVNSSNPATATLPLFSFTPATIGPFFAGMSFVTAPGVWTLQPTAASQKYAAPSGFTAWDSGGATGCSQATAYLARATGETAHPADLTALICGLVSDGVWAKLDGLYIGAQQTQADALLNLVSASYPLVVTNGTANFVQYRGFGPFNTPGWWMDTGFNAATAPSPKFTQNSASFGEWVVTAVAEQNPSFGNTGQGTPGESNIFNDYTGTSFYARVNQPSSGAVAITVGTGLFAGDRSNSTQSVSYQNGANLGVVSSASSAPVSASFQIGYVPNPLGIASLEQIGANFIGGSLGDAGQAALYSRLNTYMNAVTPCSEATAYLARATGETAHPADLTTLICGLVTDGVWAKLDALYVLAQQTQADALLNLVGTSYTLNNTGTATFAPYVGFSNLNNGSLWTGLNPTVGTPHYILNSGSFGGWIYAVTGATGTGIDFAGSAGNNSVVVANYNATNMFFARINNNVSTGVASPGTRGLFVGDRSGATAETPYWNGGSLGTQSNTTTALLSEQFVIGAGSGIFSAITDTISSAHIGASLGSAGNLALYTRLRTYMTAVGVP